MSSAQDAAGALIISAGVSPTGTTTNITGWFGSTAPTVGQKAMAASIPVVLPYNQNQLAAPGFWEFTAIPANDTDLVHSGATVMLEVGGFNPGAQSFVQLFDQIAPLAGAEVPDMVFLVPTNASFSWTPGGGGKQWTTGIVFGVSSTQDTYTAAAVNIFLFARGY